MPSYDASFAEVPIAFCSFEDVVLKKFVFQQENLGLVFRFGCRDFIFLTTTLCRQRSSPARAESLNTTTKTRKLFRQKIQSEHRAFVTGCIFSRVSFLEAQIMNCSQMLRRTNANTSISWETKSISLQICGSLSSENGFLSNLREIRDRACLG